MELISLLPKHINNRIKDYMWGSPEFYRKILGDVLDKLPSNILSNLRATEYCKYKNKLYEIDENLYCHKCGEKTLWFPFACNGVVCDYCRN